MAYFLSASEQQHNREVAAAPAAAFGNRTVVPTPFLSKTYSLVEDPALDELVSWNADGSSFVVWRPAEFARDLLPKHFKHNNFSSFVRQLNTYGFRKVAPDRWEFSHDCFRRGDKRRLCDIHRRKVATTTHAPSPVAETALNAMPPPQQPNALITSAIQLPPAPMSLSHSSSSSASDQASSANSCAQGGRRFHPPSPPGEPPRCRAVHNELMGENQRLRKENMHLSEEVTQMKGICNNILSLMSRYNNAGGSQNNKQEGRSCNSPMLKGELEDKKALSEDSRGRMAAPFAIKRERSAAEEQNDAMLFGVSIGSKRGRGGREDFLEYQHLQQQLYSWDHRCKQRHLK